jgi:hypothetical protein
LMRALIDIVVQNLLRGMGRGKADPDHEWRSIQSKGRCTGMSLRSQNRR